MTRGNEIERRVSLGKALVKDQTARFAALFGKVESQWKRDGSRVTEADYSLSQAFEAGLREAFPEDRFFSEECEEEKAIPLDSRYCWLLDPIDGTNNFARGIPSCSISLALLEYGNPVYGFVYDHMSGKLIHGGKGWGLSIEDEKVAIGEEAAPSGQSIVSAQHCSSEDCVRDDRALQLRFKIRNFGSSAIQLAYVAAGWTDGVIAHRVKAWDIAAGAALIETVGGEIRYLGAPLFPMKAFDARQGSSAYLAARPKMLEAMLETIGRK